MKGYLGIDVGGTSIKAGIVSNEGQILEREKLNLPDNWEGLKAVIKSIYEDKKLKFEIPGIGLATPGTVNPDTGYISGLLAPSLEYILGKTFFELKDDLDLPVAIEQDANCSAIGEFWVGNAIGVKNAGAMVLGSGL